MATWDQFKIHFENVHNNFFKALITKFPNITSDEVRLCAYLRINLTSKEISQMLYILPTSVNKRRTRLRKKMGLSQNEDLHQFLIKF